MKSNTGNIKIKIPKQNSLMESMASGIIIFLAVKGHFTSKISGLTCNASSTSVISATWWLKLWVPARRMRPSGLAPKTPFSCNYTPTCTKVEHSALLY